MFLLNANEIINKKIHFKCCFQFGFPWRLLTYGRNKAGLGSTPCLGTGCDLDGNTANYSCAHLRQGLSRCHEFQDQLFPYSDKPFLCCTLAGYEIAEKLGWRAAASSIQQRLPQVKGVKQGLDEATLPQYSAGFERKRVK